MKRRLALATAIGNLEYMRGGICASENHFLAELKGQRLILFYNFSAADL